MPAKHLACSPLSFLRAEMMIYSYVLLLPASHTDWFNWRKKVRIARYESQNNLQNQVTILCP